MKCENGELSNSLLFKQAWVWDGKSQFSTLVAANAAQLQSILLNLLTCRWPLLWWKDKFFLLFSFGSLLRVLFGWYVNYHRHLVWDIQVLLLNWSFVALVSVHIQTVFNNKVYVFNVSVPWSHIILAVKLDIINLKVLHAKSV